MTEQRAFYHDGMRALQDRFDGRRVADRLAEHRRRWDFWDDDRVMIESAPFFFIATSYGDYTDCSMRSGMPGFVKIVAPGTIDSLNTTATRCIVRSVISAEIRMLDYCS